MNRRKFLNAIGAGGAVAWLVPNTVFAVQNTAPVYTTPVSFINDPSAAALTESDLAALFTVDAAQTQLSQSATYPQSVASGDPSPIGIVLWTRVAPEAQAGPNASTVGWQIAADPGFASLVIEGMGTLDSARDNTVKLPLQNAVLQPFSVYYYRFVYNGIASRTGRFKTLPAPASALTDLRLGYVVCQDYGNGYYNALRYLAQEEVDYVVHLGDYIYETYDSASFQSNSVRSFPPFPSGSTTIPIDVADYRHLYHVYRGDPDLQALHERLAFIQLWDDHEFANDCHQDFHPDNNVAPNSATTPQPALRQAANQA
ncbi:MAG TPA: alkaline phosphatase D family protein, partial [Bryobacteraceae bacterium]